MVGGQVASQKAEQSSDEKDAGCVDDFRNDVCKEKSYDSPTVAMDNFPVIDTRNKEISTPSRKFKARILGLTHGHFLTNLSGESTTCFQY
ncbi:hypothetical protein GOP47_0017715 [Adiantum capillus-veneris]|uniref:Uncharacterized protein n=1 Tax=Adiantum capillus-veneris TaxID=13818 RepID=A0A9D4UGB9_ADICA|nr:hypothetical protein GOP47_0017715 [Adiantum capillus-veneris]